MVEIVSICSQNTLYYVKYFKDDHREPSSNKNALLKAQHILAHIDSPNNLRISAIFRESVGGSFF